jgi:hypothetical protein
MGSGVPPALRWLGALAAMLLVVAITLPRAVEAILGAVQIDDAGTVPIVVPDEDELDDALAPVEPVDDGAAEPVHDFSGRDAEVRQAAEPFVAIGGVEGDATYFVFDPIPGSAGCVAEARLEITLLEATPTMLSVHPADVPGAATVEDGDDLPENPFLTPDPQAIAQTDGSPGRLMWDVTSLYRRWGEGEFGDHDRFVVAVRPPQYDDPDLRVQFASVESAEPAVLTWTGLPDCP